MQHKKLHSASLVFARLKEVAEADTLKELADFLDIKAGTLRSQKTRGSIPYEEIVAKCSAWQVAYVLKGSEAYEGYRPQGELANIVTEPQGKESSCDEFYTLPFYASVKASAGGGIIPQEKEPLEIAFRKYFINNTLGVNSTDLFAMKISGDSMEPTLKTDDMVLVDQSKRTPRSGNILVIRIDETVSCKRIQELPGHRFKIMSDNAGYESFEVDAGDENFEILGTIVWFGRNL